MKHASCKPRSEFFIKHHSVRLPRPMLAWALCLTAVVSASASAQQVCANAFKYFDDVSHWKRGVDDVVEPTVVREKRRQLNACVAATTDAAMKGNALSKLGHLSLAEDNFQEAIQLYRRTLSAANWKTDSEIKFRDDLVDAIWESKDYRSYIREASYMLSHFGSRLGHMREFLYARRAMAHEKLGNKKAALADFQQSALLEENLRKGAAAEQALRIMREQSWRTSCAILDAYDFSAGDELTKIDDCLSSTNLPSIDKARAYRLQASLYERDKNSDASFQSILKLLRLPVDPPTYTDLDRGDIWFKGSHIHNSMMHWYLYHMIRQDQFSEIAAHLEDTEIEYRRFLGTALADSSPLKSSYSFYQQETKSTDEEIATRFLMPTIEWLAQKGDPGIATAKDILDSRVHKIKDARTRARLLMARGEVKLRMRDLRFADDDFETAASLAEKAKERWLSRKALRMRALIAANEARFSDAYDFMNKYFEGLSKTWASRATNDLVEAQTLRADFAARAGLGDEARKHVDILKGIYEQHGQPCEPCAQIEQNMAK